MQFLPLLVGILSVAAFSTGTLSGDKAEQCQIAQASLINFPELKPILLEQILSWQKSPTAGFRGPLSASIKQLLTAVECLIAPPEGFIADHGAAKNLPTIFKGISKFLASMDVNFCLPLQVTENICASSGYQATSGTDDVPNLAAAVKEFLESRFASDESQLSKFLKDLVAHGSTNDKQYREHRLSRDRLRGYCLAENQLADWQNLADRLKETFQPSVVCGAGQSLKCGEASNLPLCLLRYATIASLTKWTCDTLAWKNKPLAQNGTEIKAILQTIDSTIDNGMKTASGLIKTACGFGETTNFNSSSTGRGGNSSDSGTISDVQRPHSFFGNPELKESKNDYLKNSSDTAFGESNITNQTRNTDDANSNQTGNLTDSSGEHKQQATNQTAVEPGLPLNRRVRRSKDGDGKDQDPASLEQADITQESDQEQDVPPGWGSLDWPKPNSTVDLPEPYQPRPSFKPYQPKPSSEPYQPKPSSEPYQPRPSFKPYQPKPSSEPYQPKPSSEPYQPRPSFKPYQPKPSFKPYQPKPSFKPYEPPPSFKPYQPKPSSEPYQPKPSFKPYQPKPSFKPYEPQPSFKPYQPQPSFKPYEPKPSFKPYEPQPSFKPYQPKPSFKPYKPQPSFKPYEPQPSFKPYHPKPSSEPYHPKPSSEPYQPKPSFTPYQPKPSSEPYQPHTGQPKSDTERSTEIGQMKRRFKRDDNETNDKDPEQAPAANEDQSGLTEGPDPDQDPDFPPGWGSILPKDILDWAKLNFTIDMPDPNQPQTDEPELNTSDQGPTENSQIKRRFKRDDDTSSTVQDPDANENQSDTTEDPDQDPNLPPGWGSLLPKGALDWTKRNFTAEDIEEPQRNQEDKPAAVVASEKDESDGKEGEEKELSRPKRIEREAAEEESPMRLSTILSGKAFLGGDKAYRLKARQSTMKPDTSEGNHRAARETKKEVIGEVESIEDDEGDGKSLKQPRDANADGAWEKQSGEDSAEAD